MYLSYGLPRLADPHIPSGLIVPLSVSCKTDSTFSSNIAKIFPDNFEIVKLLCQFGELNPGSIYISPARRLINPRYLIFLFLDPTWNSKFSLTTISSCFARCKEEIPRLDIESVTIPVKEISKNNADHSLIKSLIVRMFDSIESCTVIYDENQPVMLSSANSAGDINHQKDGYST